jgi:hypothetical protein
VTPGLVKFELFTVQFPRALPLNGVDNSTLSPNYYHKQLIALKMCCKVNEKFLNTLIIKSIFLEVTVT